MPRGRIVSAVTDASFDVRAGECLVLVGESGCGKSVLASALLGLLPGNAQTAGSAALGDTGIDLLAADERTLARRVRGRLVGLVPQSPAAHLTPVRTVRSQLEETLAELRGTRRGLRRRGLRGRGLLPGPGGLPGRAVAPTPTVVPAGGVGSARAVAPTGGVAPPGAVPPARAVSRGRAALRAAAEEAAERAAFPASHLDRYPHELSGGLAQRAATALALAGEAPLLLADEPTTGLDRDLVDRTVDELRRHIDTDPADGTGRRGMLMITHDLAAASRAADRVAVMYAGRIVEICDAADFFGARGPRHPYSRGLLDALPDRAFTPVPGLPPELSALPPGCAFAPRCAHATRACGTVPALAPTPDAPATGRVACHHPAPAALPSRPGRTEPAEPTHA
ncbi:ABC transporter ATP-binding protein [Streptomyces sp. NPDC047130]|uniref:ABC transporter ATP-binding protein n=1 Tax=Streptomyces sp. NPDC047130 TaxID=3155261 RepID=UPI003400970A